MERTPNQQTATAEVKMSPEGEPMSESLAQYEQRWMDERATIAAEEEAERCPDCGNTPETGACFYCRMD